MRTILIGFQCLVLLSHGMAQSVSAIVKDSATLSALKLVTVGIYRPGKDSVLQETVTDDKGRFFLQKPNTGDFEIRLSSVGYHTKIFAVSLGAGDAQVNLGTITMTPRADLMKAVIVDSKRRLIEEHLDRIVYNVEKDKTISGGDATEALRRVPLLSVDMDGNVSLRGSQNFKVLINSKPSTISASNLADAMKQIPADQIKSIEVITSPSAKYDADGSAGIINIILKKNELRGIILDPDMAIGTRASFLGVNGGYNNNKMAISVGGFGRATYNVTGQYNNIQQTGAQEIYQTAGIRKSDLSGNYSVGLDYDLDKKNYLRTSLRYSLLNSHNYQDNLLSQIYDGRVQDSVFLDQVQVTARSGTADVSIDFTHVFAKPQQEFSLLTLFSQTDRTSEFTDGQQSLVTDSLIGRLHNIDVSTNQEITFQADYQSPVDSNQLFDIGTKYILRNVSSDYKYLIAPGIGDYNLVAAPNLTNLFNYHQNVLAGYFDYTLTTRSAYSFRVGARYEYTTISAGLQDPSPPIASIPSYGVLVPNFIIARRLKNGRLVKLSYNRRIQRPSILLLNPNLAASNPLNVTTGNPALAPEYTNNLEIGYSTAINGFTLDFAGFYRRTTKAIEGLSLPSVSGDTIKRTYANIGNESTVGTNVFANIDIGKKLSLSGGADLYYTTLNNDLPLTDSAGHNKGWILSARLSGGYTIKEGWTIYLFSRYKGRQLLLQGYQSGFPYYSLTLKRDLGKKKGTIGLGAENFLSPSISVKNFLQSDILYQHSTTQTHTISFRIYMSYNFGKLTTEKPERKKKSITNDDLKQG